MVNTSGAGSRLLEPAVYRRKGLRIIGHFPITGSRANPQNELSQSLQFLGRSGKGRHERFRMLQLGDVHADLVGKPRFGQMPHCRSIPRRYGISHTVA